MSADLAELDFTLDATEIPLHSAEILEARERETLLAECRALLDERGAVLVAHYYVDADIQDLAVATGGTVSDSLEMARFGRDHPARTLVVSGVRFMGESAKILSPGKRVIMPRLDANCSLDLGCPPDAFEDFIRQHPDRTVVVYANTSVRVKALSDWVVTSSVALKIAEHLAAKGEKILWAPDKHLGDWIARETGADMLLWNAACIVHDEFKGRALEDLRRVHGDAGVLVHPESPRSVIAQADLVGSTSQIIAAAQSLPNQSFIVATDRGIFHKLRRECPDKTFIEAPTAGHGATCKSCAHCPWMAMNELKSLKQSLIDMDAHEIHVDPALGERAMLPLTRMLEFGASAVPRTGD